MVCNYLKRLDSGFRLSACGAQAGRNDGKWCFSTFQVTQICKCVVSSLYYLTFIKIVGRGDFSRPSVFGELNRIAQSNREGRLNPPLPIQKKRRPACRNTGRLMFDASD